MGPVAVGQHPDERVRVVEALPDADDLGTVLLEDRHFLLAEALVQLVDAAERAGVRPRLVDGVHAHFEAARRRVHVLREFGWELPLRSARPERGTEAGAAGCWSGSRDW